MKSVLSVSGLSFRYNSIDVLMDISFEVSAGDYVALVGPNGSGKTTLIKLILGLLRPYLGKVFLFEQLPEDFHDWDKVGYMPQNLAISNPIFPATVQEVVSLGLLSKKNFPKRITNEDKKIILESLGQLEITDLKDKLIGSLSSGQQQRVFLARALIAKPELLILDEPSNALDAMAREQFFSLLEELNSLYGTTIIFITHDIGQVGRYASKLLYLDKEVVFYGTFADFCKSEKMSRQFGIDTQHLICHQHD